MHQNLIESLKTSGIRKRKITRVFESIRKERENLRSTLKESTINEQDVVTAVTNIVKSLADLKLDETKDIEVELEEKAEEIAEETDEKDKKELAEEAEEIVTDLIAEYDIEDFEGDLERLPTIESTEIDLDEEDDLDEPADNYDPKTMDESSEPEDLEQIDVDVEYVEPEFIEENDALDTLEDNVADAIEEVENLTKELEESDDEEEKKEIAEELEKAIEEAEDEIDHFEEEADEDDQPAIAYVNEARNVIKRSRAFLESERVFKENFELDIEESDDELDEETEKDVEDIVEELLGDEPDLKEQAEDALDTVKEMLESYDDLEESEDEQHYTKEELEKMEETLEKFLDESEETEVDEDEVDDIIKNIGESEDKEFNEESDQEAKIVEEGINSLCRRLGMKAKDRREFSSLFEMAVTNAAKRVHRNMVKRQDLKLRRLAEGFTKMAVVTGKKVLTENKKNIEDRLIIEESAKANRLITEALRSNGYHVLPESTTRRVKRYEEIAKRKERELAEAKSLLEKQKTLMESKDRKYVVTKVARDRNLTLSEEIKLEKMCRSLKGSEINENKVEELAKIFFNENKNLNKNNKGNLGRTSYFKESEDKTETENLNESTNKKETVKENELINSVLQYLR